jgi:hypothetical protein
MSTKKVKSTASISINKILVDEIKVEIEGTTYVSVADFLTVQGRHGLEDLRYHKAIKAKLVKSRKKGRRNESASD